MAAVVPLTVKSSVPMPVTVSLKVTSHTRVSALVGVVVGDCRTMLVTVGRVASTVSPEPVTAPWVRSASLPSPSWMMPPFRLIASAAIAMPSVSSPSASTTVYSKVNVVELLPET